MGAFTMLRGALRFLGTDLNFAHGLHISVHRYMWYEKKSG